MSIELTAPLSPPVETRGLIDPRKKLLCTLAFLTAIGAAHQVVHTVPAGADAGVAAYSDEDDVGAVHVAHAASAASMAAFAEVARTDPLKLAELASESYEKNVREYRCVFLKQERIGKKLSPLQEIEVLFRERPHAVFMKWLRNPDQCRRALYVADRLVDKKGRQLALVEPNGAIVRLFISKTKIAINGSRSKKASRRTIDQFGFRSTLRLLDDYNQLAKKRGVLKMMYEGEGRIDGRPTFVVARHLPYSGPGSEFPDARMVIHFDQEWMLPVAVYSWADFDEKKLLGSYVMTKVRLNPGFSDADFEF